MKNRAKDCVGQAGAWRLWFPRWNASEVVRPSLYGYVILVILVSWVVAEPRSVDLAGVVLGVAAADVVRIIFRVDVRRCGDTIRVRNPYRTHEVSIDDLSQVAIRSAGWHQEPLVVLRCGLEREILVKGVAPSRLEQLRRLLPEGSVEWMPDVGRG